MSGYPFNDNYGVKAIGTIRLSGDIAPATWSKFIVNKKGKQNSAAIKVMAKLAYLHRPMRETDLDTQQERPWRKMFAEEFYRIDYRQFGTFVDLTDRQVRESVTALRKLGILNIHLVYDKRKNHLRGTEVYVEIIPTRYDFITNRPNGVSAVDMKAPCDEGKIYRHRSVESLQSTCDPNRSQTHRKLGVWNAPQENSSESSNSFNPNESESEIQTHRKLGVWISDSQKIGRHIGTKIPKTKIPETTRIPPTSLAQTSEGMDGLVVGSNSGNDFSTRGSLALAPTFEDLPFDSNTNAEDSKKVSGENSGDEPSPAKAPNVQGRRIFHQTNHVPTILPAAVQALIEWNLETVACPVSQNEVQLLVELCRDEQYSFAELTACYLAHKAPGSGWKLPSWKTVAYDIPKFAALYRAVAAAIVNLPDLPALVTAIGSDWNKLPLTDQHNWAVAIQKFGWHLAGVPVFLAYFAQTPKGRKGFSSSVADLRDHWQRALETQTLQTDLTEAQQSLVTQLTASGVNKADATAVVL